MSTVTPTEFHLECPDCHEEIPVPVVVEIFEGEEGEQRINLEPDLADLWSHAWSCAEREG